MPKCPKAAVYASGITVLHTTEAKSNALDLLCFQDELSLDAADGSQLDVLGVTTALKTAAHDPRIKAVLLDLSGSSYSGSATIMEVRCLLHFCTARCSSAYAAGFLARLRLHYTIALCLPRSHGDRCCCSRHGQCVEQLNHSYHTCCNCTRAVPFYCSWGLSMCRLMPPL